MNTTDPDSPTLHLTVALLANKYGSVMTALTTVHAGGMSVERMAIIVRESLAESLEQLTAKNAPGVWVSFLDSCMCSAIAQVDCESVIKHILADAAGKSVAA